MANNRPIARYISFFCEYSAFFIAKKSNSIKRIAQINFILNTIKN